MAKEYEIGAQAHRLLGAAGETGEDRGTPHPNGTRSQLGAKRTKNLASRGSRGQSGERCSSSTAG